MVGVPYSHPRPGGLARFDRFVIEARLGVGGMSEVFRARDGQQPIALKLMRPEIAADPRHQLLFVTEAQLAARLRHRSLLHLHDFGRTNGVLWMALELVDGLSLDRLLAAGPLPAPVAAHVAVELLDALTYVHAQGMVHRDVATPKVLISTKGKIRLSDFRMAKVSTTSLTRANESNGKPSCMAPEQLRGPTARDPIDHRVDLFAVGVLLHRMTRGEAPFTHVAEWLHAGAPHTATGPLARVIARAMQPERQARFADAAAMTAAIIRALPGAVSAGAEAELAAHVRAGAVAVMPMTHVERLVIATVAAGAGTSDSFVDQMPTTMRDPVCEQQDDVSERMPTLLHGPSAIRGGDSFAEEAPTQARSFDQTPTSVRATDGTVIAVQLADSSSENVCAELAVGPSTLVSLPRALAGTPMLMVPARRSRWPRWLLVAAVMVTLGLASSRVRPPNVPAPAVATLSPFPAAAVVAPTAAEESAAGATEAAALKRHGAGSDRLANPQRQGTRAGKVALRSAR
jgi:hypothetical protein